jgi:hypothetical protein
MIFYIDILYKMPTKKCEHRRQCASRCSECLGHQVNKDKCSRCKKPYIGEVIDGKLLQTCEKCRSESCPHGIRFKSKCEQCQKEDRDENKCEHDKRKNRCISCTNKRCIHNLITEYCKICKSCKHKKRKDTCIVCSPKIACNNCKLEIMSTNKKYRPYCFKCFCVLNPDIEIPRRYKVKETHLQEALI